MNKSSVLVAVSSWLLFSFAGYAEALEPKLLWTKEFKDVIGFSLAKDSGDILVREENKLILFNKSGNVIFNWGPRADRLLYSYAISKDGKTFIFKSGLTEKYAEAKKINVHDDTRVHFYENGKEKWSFVTQGDIHLSPDGTYIIISYGNIMSDGSFYIIDPNGKKIFSYEDRFLDNLSRMSGDGNYFTALRVYEELNEADVYELVLFNRAGGKLWSRPYADMAISMADGAKYITTYPFKNIIVPEKNNNGLILDKNGNILHKGFGIVAGDGSVAVLLAGEKTKVVSLPDMKILREMSIKASIPVISHDGRCLVLHGRKTDGSSENNLFLFDFKDGTTAEMSIDVYVSDIFDIPSPQLQLTNDGRYLVEIDKSRKKLYYYSLY